MVSGRLYELAGFLVFTASVSVHGSKNSFIAFDVIKEVKVYERSVDWMFENVYSFKVIYSDNIIRFIFKLVDIYTMDLNIMSRVSDFDLNRNTFTSFSPFVKEVVMNIKSGEFFVMGSNIVFKDFDDLVNSTLTELNLSI